MKKFLFLFVTFILIFAAPLTTYGDTRIMDESWSNETYYNSGDTEEIIDGGDRVILGVKLTEVSSKETVTVKAYRSGDRQGFPIYTFKIKNPTKGITYSSGYFDIPGNDERFLVIIIESSKKCSGTVRAYKE
ncbi:hypothetical protein [Clostridium cellulovorans]|uniref:Uncharacterized protein n=1 Tax=Clostridium cellulovorans (strain ATCC 35296 / DSM 3052 / OCM 3 / 743B) TaxID=573061 RepID=D9SNQ3_CLOC7|nr:hypothetical protein [Clostridium cellulovorans]ADL49924.1 hypothetical protein Clocel_0135 [Clostridium cellulovorans 743B]